MVLPHFMEPVYVTVSGCGPARALLLPDRTSDVEWACFGDGSVRFLGDGSVRPGITDGTSNTIQIGEQRSVSSGRRTGGTQVTDGTSNTIQFGETPSGGGRSRGGSNTPSTGSPTITDGTSNTILFGETGRMGDGSVRNLRCGSSRSSLFGENGGITDGSSNTIAFGESSPVWGNPSLFGPSFRLLLPAHLSVLFESNDLELRIRSAGSRRGLLARGVALKSVTPVIGGRALFQFGAQGIIAILIGL